jgi:hypothetical protein
MPHNVTYATRKAQGLCPGCGLRMVIRGRCRVCKARRRDARARAKALARVRREVSAARNAQRLGEARPPVSDAPAAGANQILCCGTWHPIPTLPYRLPCCGRVLGMVPTPPTTAGTEVP